MASKSVCNILEKVIGKGKGKERDVSISIRYASRSEMRETYSLRLEPLYEDAVEQRNEGFDGFESSLGGLAEKEEKVQSVALHTLFHYRSMGPTPPYAPRPQRHNAS